VIVQFGSHCSGTKSVTALICSCWNRAEPDTGYSHLLDCSSVTYRGENAAHTHIYHSMTLLYNISTRHLELTMISINCLQYSLVYAKCIAKMLCIVRLRNKKCSETGPQRCCSGPEQYQYLFRYYL